MKDLNRLGTILVVTNPLTWPVLAGIGLAALVDGLFGGAIDRIEKNFDKLGEE